MPVAASCRGKTLTQKRFDLEARVGIEPGKLLFQNPPKPFGSGYFSKCYTGKEIITHRELNQANIS